MVSVVWFPTNLLNRPPDWWRWGWGRLVERGRSGKRSMPLTRTATVTSQPTSWGLQFNRFGAEHETYFSLVSYLFDESVPVTTKNICPYLWKSIMPWSLSANEPNTCEHYDFRAFLKLEKLYIELRTRDAMGTLQGKRPSEKEVQEMIEMADVDGDKQICYEEFVAIMTLV